MARRRETAEERHQRIEFEQKQRELREQWLAQVQRRAIAGSDQQMKIGLHGMTMAERAQKMAIAAMKARIELANAQADIAKKWIAFEKERTQLLALKRALKEFQTQLKSHKKEERALLKHAEKINRWLDASERLVWGELVNPKLLTVSWNGLLSIIKSLDRADQRKIALMSVTKKESQSSNFIKPSSPNSEVPEMPKSRGKRTVMAVFLWAKKKRVIPLSGSDFQMKMFEVMDFVDEATAIQGADFTAKLEATRAKLLDLRSQSWKKVNLV